MFDSDNKLSLFKLISLFLIATLASVGLTSFISGILLSINSYFGADITDVLPVKSSSEHLFSWWSAFMLNPDGFNLAVVAISSVVLFSISLALIFIVFKDYKADTVKIGVVLILIFVGPAIYLTLKELDFLDKVLLYYIDDYNALFHLILMVVIFPSWIIVGTCYILLNQSNLLWKVLIAVIYCLPIYYFDLDFYNSLYISTERFDIRKEIAHINTIDLKPDKSYSKYVLIESSGSVLLEDQVSDYDKVPLTKHNFVVLHNYIMNNPESALAEPITNYVEKYYFDNMDPDGYRDYLVKLYKKNPSPFISAKLVSFLKNYSNPENSIEKLENKINESKKDSKVGFGFIAALYDRLDQKEKSDEFWKKYESSKDKSYLNSYIKEWVEKRYKRANENIKVKGILNVDGVKLSDTKLMLVTKAKDDKYTKMIDVAKSDSEGNFELKMNSCEPFALMLDVPDNMKVKKLEGTSKIELNDCKAPVDIGNIDLKSSN